MDNKEDFFGDDLTFNRKIDDFSASAKEKTIDFLSSERADEKTDVKEKNVDDFLNFHDDLGDDSFQQSDFMPSDPILMPTFEKKDEPKLAEPVIDFSGAAAMDDEYLNPYGAMKSNEKFISSEDLLTDFKDPIEEAPTKELPPPPKPVEQPIVLPKVQPVVEEKKAAVPPPAAPSKAADTQIEAEKIFKSIGLGKSVITR